MPVENPRYDEKPEDGEKINKIERDFARQKLYPTLNAGKAIDAKKISTKPVYQTVRASNNYGTESSESKIAVHDSPIKANEEMIPPPQYPSMAKANNRTKMASSQPKIDIAPPKLTYRSPATPMESDYDSTEDR